MARISTVSAFGKKGVLDKAIDANKKIIVTVNEMANVNKLAITTTNKEGLSPQKQFESGTLWFTKKWPQEPYPAYMWRDGLTVIWLMYADGVRFQQSFSTDKEADGVLFQFTKVVGRNAGAPGDFLQDAGGGIKILSPSFIDEATYYLKQYWWIVVIIVGALMLKRR